MSTLAVIAYPDQSTAAEAAAALPADAEGVPDRPRGRRLGHQGTGRQAEAPPGHQLDRRRRRRRRDVGLPLRLALPRPPRRDGRGRGHRRPGRTSRRLSASTTSGSRRWRARSNRAARRSLSWRATPTRSGSCRRWPSSAAPCIQHQPHQPSSSRHWKRRWPRPRREGAAAAGAGIGGSRTRRRAPAPRLPENRPAQQTLGERGGTRPCPGRRNWHRAPSGSTSTS